jgi:hypothetical protein
MFRSQKQKSRQPTATRMATEFCTNQVAKIAKKPADKKSDSNSHRSGRVSDVSLHTFGHKSAVGQMVAHRLK